MLPPFKPIQFSSQDRKDLIPSGRTPNVLGHEKAGSMIRFGSTSVSSLPTEKTVDTPDFSYKDSTVSKSRLRSVLTELNDALDSGPIEILRSNPQSSTYTIRLADGQYYSYEIGSSPGSPASLPDAYARLVQLEGPSDDPPLHTDPERMYFEFQYIANRPNDRAYLAGKDQKGDVFKLHHNDPQKPMDREYQVVLQAIADTLRRLERRFSEAKSISEETKALSDAQSLPAPKL
jgi:hypothetical protein